MNKAHDLIARVVSKDEVKERLLQTGVVVKTGAPADFQALLKSQVETWQTIRKSAGIEQR